MSMIEKLKKNSSIKDASILNKSKFFNAKDMITTRVPMINVALSGQLDGGLVPGLTQFAAPSKHFKTGFMLLLANVYFAKYPDAALLFYDSEFGTPLSYFDSFDIDKTRVLHSPITDVEQLKFDIMKQLKEMERNDHIMIIVDSIGNLASKKEVEDALTENSAADMSRPKQLKSLFRMVTPHLNLKDIPMIVANHTYMTMEKYAKTVVGGGTGSYYSADNIFIIGRQQDTETSGADKGDLLGYDFIINVEKSRYVREKSKIAINVSFDGGIMQWSGLLDNALESHHVGKPTVGWYSKIDQKTGEMEEKKYRESDTNIAEFWEPILADPTFQDFIREKYKVSSGSIMQYDEEVVDEIDG